MTFMRAVDGNDDGVREMLGEFDFPYWEIFVAADRARPTSKGPAGFGHSATI